MEKRIWRGLAAAEVDRQYAPRKLRPSYGTGMAPRWVESSAAYRGDHPGALVDLAYGPGPFRPLSGGPARRALRRLHPRRLLAARGQTVYSAPARPFNEAGVDVALVNYPLCPSVRLSRIAPRVRRAVAHLWREARDLGCPRERFCVAGHSAGGHPAAETMATDWTAEAADLPAGTIDDAMPSSGVFDFRPMLHCSENEGLRLDAGEAERAGVLGRPMTTDAPQLVVWGALETPELDPPVAGLRGRGPVPGAPGRDVRGSRGGPFRRGRRARGRPERAVPAGRRPVPGAVLTDGSRGGGRGVTPGAGRRSS